MHTHAHLIYTHIHPINTHTPIRVLCQVDVKNKDMNDFTQAIKRQYHHNWIVDNLPAGEWVGVYMCVYVYICVCMYMCVYVCVRVYVYVCVYVYIYVCIYIYMCVCVCVWPELTTRMGITSPQVSVCVCV